MRVHLVRTLDAPIPDLDGLAKPFLDWFSEASGQTLVLEFVFHDRPVDHSGPCASYQLHSILERVLPVPESLPVDDVAIIFCHSWPTASLYGLMFDWDADITPLGSFTANGVPRQGCAVFMGEHGSTKEAVRTAIHELGHVFNLVHDRHGTSFMASPPAMDRFTGDDGVRLRLAAESHWNYAPGCRNYWGEGVFDPPRLRRARDFRLRATVPRRSRILGEPIALDLRLKVASGRRRAWDRLDPGYPELRIWIETPKGERVLHRPPAYFCAKHMRTTLRQGRSLRNNPRLTLGGSDPRLAEPGSYRVWAEFRPTLSSWLESNVVDVRVRLPQTQEEAEISALLVSPGVNRFLVDKGGPLADGTRRELERLLRASQHPALAYARYAAAWDAHRRREPTLARQWLDKRLFGDGSLRAGAERLRRALTA